MKRILLTTTSFQDTPGAHHKTLEETGWEIVTARGPLPEAEVLKRVGDIDGFICGDDAITRKVLEKALPRLKVLSKYGIGVDKIDVAAATDLGIPVCYTPGVNHTTVAEHCFALLLALVKNLVPEVDLTRAGQWKRLIGHEIMGRKIGIVGLGRIGKEVAVRGRAFGLEVQGYDIYWDDVFAREQDVARCDSVEALFATSDIISLHTNLSEETRGMINLRSLSKMKDGVIIINCARGELVETDAMVHALKIGKVGGYGTDVLDEEPPPADHPLLSAENCLVTPHIGSRTYESVVRQAGAAVTNLVRVLNGEAPLAQVNKVPGPNHGDTRTGDVTTDDKKPTAKVEMTATETFHIVPEDRHNALVHAAYTHRGYDATESAMAARFSAHAARHGIRTHNALKALHLDHLFGSGSKGCVPRAKIEKAPSRFGASEVWNANRKLGQAVAYEAIEHCMSLADKYGVGMVSVDNAFHYLWGGGYVMEAARRGYIAYTNCTAALAEMVPFMGKYPTLGTNPHSWGFPTVDAVGYPIVIDWATSVVAMGRVQQLAREGKPLPPNAAVDEDGNPTTDASKAKHVLPFGAHKGYGLALVNEIVAAFIGGSLPTVRSRWTDDTEKHTPCFFFQVIHPEALSAGVFAGGRSQAANVKAVIDDILGHGNEGCMLPGQIEAEFAKRCDAAGGLLFSAKEIAAFSELAAECGEKAWNVDDFEVAG